VDKPLRKSSFDLQGLLACARGELFGPGYQGVLLFAYQLLPTVAVPDDTEDLWTWRGRRYRTTDANLRRPWIHLLRWVPDFTWQTTYLGTGYIGSGTVR